MQQPKNNNNNRQPNIFLKTESTEGRQVIDRAVETEANEQFPV